MAIERLACRLPDVYTDLLTVIYKAFASNARNCELQVIASGTSESRIAAANLLFHYWPLMNPAIMHRRSIQYRVIGWLINNQLITFIDLF